MYPAARKFVLEVIGKSSSAGVGDVKELLRHPGKSVEGNYMLERRVAEMGAVKADGGGWLWSWPLGAVRRLVFGQKDEDGEGTLEPWVSLFYLCSRRVERVSTYHSCWC